MSEFTIIYISTSNISLEERLNGYIWYLTKKLMSKNMVAETMSLLDMIFPNLKNYQYGDHIPSWHDRESPWSILSKESSNSITQQILNLKLKESEKEYYNFSIDETKGPVYIHPSAKIGEYVKFEGPCYIGKNAEIRHCAFLRQGSWICEYAVVGHSSEIKNSILLPGAKAPHFNYVGDSILGFNVNVGAGAKISNVRHDKRNILICFSDGTKVDSKLKKFGALIGDEAEIGCNVVSNPGTIIEPGTMIRPNSTLIGWNKS